MTPKELIAYVQHYFTQMTASDIDGIVGIFEPNGFVVSPFLGKVVAPAFFKVLGDKYA